MSEEGDDKVKQLKRDISVITVVIPLTGWELGTMKVSQEGRDWKSLALVSTLIIILSNINNNSIIES